MSLTQSLQEDGVSGLNLLLVQQAEETTRHVDHVLDVEKQAVQVGRRRLQTQAYDNLLYVKQNSTVSMSWMTTSRTLGSGGRGWWVQEEPWIKPIQIKGLLFWYPSVLYVRTVTNFQEAIAQTTIKKCNMRCFTGICTIFFVDNQNNLDFMGKNNFQKLNFFKVRCSSDEADCLADLDAFEGVFMRWLETSIGFGCGRGFSRIQIKCPRLQGP